MKNSKLTLAKSLLALLMCVTMLVSTTFAWFTDSVTSSRNMIATGTLDVELYHSNGAVTNERVTESTQLFLDQQGNPILWEPGVVSYENLRIVNEGSLALVYQLALNVTNENYIIDGGNRFGLSQVLKVGVVEDGITATDRDSVINAVSSWTKLESLLRDGSLIADAEKTWGIVIYWQPGDNDNNWNANNGKQLSSGTALSIDLGVNLTATQEMYENDSFGNDYDVSAKDDIFPSFGGGIASAPVDVANGLTTSTVEIAIGDIKAIIPTGVKVKDGVNSLSLTIKTLNTSNANIVLGENEAIRSLDVHVEGVAADNTTPIIVFLPEVAPKGLNLGNYKLYHVENGATNEMTLVASAVAFDAHNQFKYDPATGDVALYMATFSEVAVVAEPSKWEGNFDYSWYLTRSTEYIISNADQLAAFGAIVGGMNGQTQDSFAGKTVKLIADINLGDKETENNPDIIFYPIGYYNSEGTYERTNTAITSGLRNFEGTFDGNGHTIANFYHNTWEMKGDHNWYSPEEQYYRDGMGLFGKVYGGTVKNLTVKNFSSDGEIATTGVIAAYADGATFENIAIVDCNPRVYNIGNGGIVGCVGWYAKEEGMQTTFKNITVDNSNKISALWGSYDVACGGIVGQYYPTSGQTSSGTPKNAGVYFENCHVSAQMDVYNDVCANYQYYAYRYTGMLIGSVRENETINGHSYPKMDGITASGCTVHFGDWNDYYYCELVANSLASYTHDHQFSRLEQVAKVEDTTITPLKGEAFTVPATGRYNYVVVNKKNDNGSFAHATENATCYHFVDGKVHNHEDYNGDGVKDYETVNGESILVENNQHIYLEFNNLVTGYGWGVTSKGLKDFEGVTNLDITQGDHEKSVEKFEGKNTKLDNNKTYKFGDIFTFVDKGVELVPGALTVSVTNKAENNPVSATIVYDRENWENGTITLTGIGEITITIQDYYFCTPTTITVNVTDRQPEVKFDVVMNNGDFLHRVGNSGTVALDKLFKAKNGVTVGTVSVTVEAVNGTSASGTYSNNAIDFNGTGVVKVTITDNDYCTPTELYLEVVDAENVTSATDAMDKDVVLLNNIGSSFTIDNGHTVYGNGFTLTYTGDGRYLNNGLKQGVVMVKNGGTLDNLRIKASIYPTAFMYYGTTQLGDYVQQPTNSKEVEGDKTRYYYQLSAVATYGNATISNCYIYGGRTNVYVNTGNVTIKDSVLECGVVSNVQMQSSSEYTVTLENVTTIQYRVNATIGDASQVMLGAGVLVGPETTSNPKIVLNGSFKQYNWINENDKNAVSSTVAQMIIGGALDATAYNHTVNGKTASNLGIIYMNKEEVNIENNTGLPYKEGTVSMPLDNGGSVDGQVYSLQNATDAQIYSDYESADRSTVNGDYLPTFKFDLGNQAISYDGSEDTRYLYGDKNGVTALYQDGEAPLTLDLSKLATIYKYTGLNYTVTAVCKDASGNTLNPTNGVVTLDAQGEYTLVFTVNDNIFYNKNGETITKSVTRTFSVPLTLTVKEANVKNAEVTITKTALDGVYTTVNLTDYKLRINFLDAISVTDYDNKGNGTTVSLSSNIASATLTPASVNVFTAASTITVTYTDGRVLTVNLSNISGSSPGGKTAVVNTSGGLYFITEGALDNKPTAAANQNKCTITSVSFKGNSGSTVTNDTDVTVTWALGSSGDNNPCVTPDTLITLADGSMKRIDEVTYTDKLLVWNFFEGKYDVAPAAIIFDHGADNNTVIKLTFSDGTVVKVVNMHQFYDANLNQFVTITEDTVMDYIGHKFAQYNGIDNNFVELVDCEISYEYVEAWGVMSAEHYNIITAGMLSADFDLKDVELFNYFEIGDDMKFDSAKMQADIEKYGLYTYEDFADYLTYEQFVAFNVQYFKIPVGKGEYTYQGILDLIEQYLN